ncbi:RHS repeat-associated core domain-containing protein [Cohnella fermenti]|uniref:RHS repeat-associated core domain-containing protein n=1 Tax=Cohnella fermenti TaxID=2565925 RepID=A0A4S4C4K6_9BACL|nr:hypothetical protein [Cohnella fermenti]THF82715.1 hypothetical protein E6C55_06525 [Cohnella fermenti]
MNLYTYVHNNPLIYADPTGHWCTSADGKYSHAGGCYGTGNTEVFHDVGGSKYVDDVTYAKNKLVDLLFEESSNSKMVYSAIMNDPISAVVNNASTINAVGGAVNIPPALLGAIIFREQATRKMDDDVLNYDTKIRGVEHSVGLGAIFPSTARNAWVNMGWEDELPDGTYNLAKKLTNDNTFNIVTIGLVLYDKADTHSIDITSDSSWSQVIPYYNSSMSNPEAIQLGNNYAMRVMQYMPYISILLGA